VVVDYLNKLWAVSALDGWGPQAVLPGINLVLVRNTGAAFGFLADAGGWQTFVFIGIGIVICLALIGWLVTKRREVALDTGLALILGGAAGNIIDRFRRDLLLTSSICTLGIGTGLRLSCGYRNQCAARFYW
jgi:signal peptidase II